MKHPDCLIVQIESRKGLDALEEIAAVPGVDGIFLGPADLAASLGHLGNPMQPAVQEAILRSRHAGKPVGILSSDEEQARLWISLGATFVAVGADTTLLARGARTLAARFKAAAPVAAAKSGDY